MSGLWCNCAACPKLFFPLLRFKVTLSCGLGEEANLKMFPSESDTAQHSGCLCVSVHLCVCVGCLHDFWSFFWGGFAKKPTHSGPWTEGVCALAVETHYLKAGPFSPKNVNKACGFG